MSREVMKQALEALETYLTMDTVEESHLLEVDIAPKAINALRAALAEPEPRNQCGETCERAKLCAICTRGLEEPKQNTVTCVCGAVWDGEQMVHAPRKREWVGLTDKEADEYWDESVSTGCRLSFGMGVDYANKALKEKNT
jgi:hypothetical protein